MALARAVLFWNLDPQSIAPLSIPGRNRVGGVRTTVRPARRDVTGVEPQLHRPERKSRPRTVLPELRDYRGRVPVDIRDTGHREHAEHGEDTPVGCLDTGRFSQAGQLPKSPK